MGDVTVSDALGSIRSSLANERVRGLTDLQHILKQNRRSSKLQNLGDKEYYSILEALFKVAEVEKAAYSKASKTTKVRTASKLSTCATVLHLAVQASVTVIRSKTVKALIGHILKTTIGTGNRYCEPLATHYIRTLRTVLEYQPHTEHLKSEDWQALVHFCSDGIQTSSESLEEQDSNDLVILDSSDRLRCQTSRSATPSSVNGSIASVRHLAIRNTSENTDRQIADELMQCLSALFIVPHAPILEIAEEKLGTLLEFLQVTAPLSRTQSQEAAFACINVMLSATITEDLSVATSIVKQTIPQIRRLWQQKTHHSLKKEMVLAVVHGEPLFPKLLNTDGEFRNELERLLDILQGEYSKRAERELLQPDDLLFDSVSPRSSENPLSNRVFRLRLGSKGSEQTWATLWSIAVIFTHLKDQLEADAPSTRNDRVETPKKRRKISSPLNAIIDTISTSVGPEKVAALQIISFVSLETSLDTSDLSRLFGVLTSLISSEVSSIAVWTMLTLSCLAYQKHETLPPEKRELWIQAWKVAARSITTPSTCRTACYFMNILLQQEIVNFEDVADTVDFMLSSIDLNGPASFSDASASLWSSLIKCKARHTPALVYDTSERILRWLFNRWKPALTQNRSKDILIIQQHETQDIINLMAALLGLPVKHAVYPSLLGIGSIGRGISSHMTQMPLVRYLLKDEIALLNTVPSKESRADSSLDINMSVVQFQTLFNISIDSLITEIKLVLNSEPFSEASPSSKVSGDTIRAVTSLCITGFALASIPGLRDSGKTRSLKEESAKLRRQISILASSQDDHELIIEALHASFGNLLNPTKLVSITDDQASIGAWHMAKDFVPAFWQGLEPNIIDEDAKDDLMDVEDSLVSQQSLSPSDTYDTEMSRDWLTAITNSKACKATLTARICLASMMESFNNVDTSLVKNIPTDLIEYLTQLPSSTFLSCRQFVIDILDRRLFNLDTQSAVTLLEYLAQETIARYVYERCEVALGTCLNVMTNLAYIWTDPDTDAKEVSSQLYQWFIGVALARKISSPHVHLCMAEMLHKVIEARPEYAKTLTLESSRTSLLKILEEGTAAVKFTLGARISAIFKLFVLKEHDAILDDVTTSLPIEPGWIEGTAVRIHILAELGSSWSTLIRRCIYAIVEGPGLVTACSDYARICLTQVSDRLHLNNPKELFKLFVSQILYTWLDTQSLHTIPFTVFGYHTLAELIQDVLHEVTAQVMMRGRKAEAQELSEIMSTSFSSLVEESYARCAAYCIARAAAIPPEVDEQASGGDKRLKNLVGKERYAAMTADQFSDILSIFFKIVDREDSITKGFQRHEVHTAAKHAYDEMLSSGNTGTSLTVSQQPTFKASFLVEEIDHICSLAQRNVDEMWTPALYIYVFRGLVDTAHPALGSLHSCAVVRRLRILVSMAGDVAFQDYPLEMALHSLRQFLTDTQCAENAMGLFRFLLGRGTSYLQKEPTFVAGLIVSTLTSLKLFLETPQESTTQESQFRATMSRAEEFHKWIGVFGSEYTSSQLDPLGDEAFRAIITSARQIRNVGNAKLGTYESELLHNILTDRLSGRDLIDDSSQDIILDLLCSDFEVPPNYREDILGSGHHATECASIVWNTFKHKHRGRGYALWVARILGRAYASTGFTDPKLMRETNDDDDLYQERSWTNPVSSSRFAILCLLCNLLLADNLRDIGLAERALQTIVSHTDKDKSIQEVVEELPQSLLPALEWRPLYSPNLHRDDAVIERPSKPIQEAIELDSSLTYDAWIRRLCLSLIATCGQDSILSELVPIVTAIESVPSKVFPFILHLCLLKDYKKQSIKRTVSLATNKLLRDTSQSTRPYSKQMIDAVLYLRHQPIPRESVKADRSRWLDIDYRLAAEVAVRCSMFRTALLFLEISISEEVKTTRRSSGAKLVMPTDLLLRIYQNLDEKDSFYGIRQPSSLYSMMSQLEFENAGYKSLSFRGAYYNSQIRHLGVPDTISEEQITKLLDAVDLNGLSQSVLSSMANHGTVLNEAMFRTARKLERWDISCSSSGTSQSSTLFRAFQSIHDTADFNIVRNAIDSGFSTTLACLVDPSSGIGQIRTHLSTLAVLSEIEDVLSSRGIEQLKNIWSDLQLRDEWMLTQSHEQISTIDSCRRTLFSILSRSDNLQSLLKITQSEARAFEARALLASSALNRRHGVLQSSLNSTTFLAQLVGPCEEIGLKIDAAASLEASNVLWDQGEMAASIRMLQDLVRGDGLRSQDIEVGRPEILAKLGHRISEARLEKPDEIIDKYLMLAMEALRGSTQGSEAGQVFHEFASFCDQQLQNADNLGDFRRIQNLREQKGVEVRELEKLIRKSTSSQSRDKEQLKTTLGKAKKWLELDDQEYQRLQKGRQALLSRSLENYLLCLRACDTYDSDVLRFSALWLEHFESEAANSAVAKQIPHVGSHKFASLMNQWTSRQLDEPKNAFQKLLTALIFRICIDHPYHGMYHLFSSCKSKGAKDPIALSRNSAAQGVVGLIKAEKHASPTWIAIHNISCNYVRFCMEKLDNAKFKQGAKVPLRQTSAGIRLEQDVHTYRVPPPTMEISIRPDRNYHSVPVIQNFQSDFTVANGLSMPKVVTAIATNGRKYKQLFKSGNDDLRQDSIMEQVFEQVSNLLKTHRDARQRRLSIRTYKVLPLTTQGGIIEFVPNTIALNDYLIPAHARHFPNDMKSSTCRKDIADVQTKSTDTRIRTFRHVCERFRPVLRFFFMEKFENPDEWFEKRLAYTRSTAAISILGYILGLGDRHGHNIMLDEKTGEAVHIDLGIAFEQGRILPIPELVPFRLTRDVVDGMGITKTEGVFRRCCEFTLDALRNESYSIMTILDVLRYDPLYNWSASPLRLKKLQEDQTEAPELGDALDEAATKKEKKDEQGEADRALTVVANKLSKSLSVTATVNELIQQATDERNLALLFCGWAAYA